MSLGAASEVGTPPQARTGTSIATLKLLAAFFVAIKLCYILSVGPIADEAYYWLWGQHPGLSYFDHPPFHAWLLGLSDAVFGRSLLSLRWMTLAALAGTVLVYRAWAKRFAGAEWRTVFWSSVVIYLASTTFGFFTSLAMHDYMLVFLALLSGHFFVSYFADVLEKGDGRLRDLYFGAVLLGLVGLTKYTGVLFGLGIALGILLNRPLRAQFRNPHLYGAALLAVAMQAPILIWNIENGFSSFQFHLSDRHPEGWLTRLNPMALLEFVVVSLLLISPFLVVPFTRFMMARPGTSFERAAQALAIPVFWVSTLLFLSVSLFDRVWWWWNLLAYVLLLPLAGKYMGRGLLFLGHVGLGAVLQMVLLVSSGVVPLLVVFGSDDATRSQLYGWEQLETPVRAAEAEYDADFIAAVRSETAGVLAFALDDRNVTALTPVLNQFDYWFDPAAHEGQSAIVVLSAYSGGQDVLAERFARVTPIGEIPIERFGHRLNTYSLFLGEGYIPPP